MESLAHFQESLRGVSVNGGRFAFSRRKKGARRSFMSEGTRDDSKKKPAFEKKSVEMWINGTK